ncbi:hypothetical protein Scep_014446 [Stephania cephalantha]|uniref:Uncharacterized protein n=1 Tax=Stephania cephalantha TaxID=152367 RepID=A0AAP0J211_9MAGN
MDESVLAVPGMEGFFFQRRDASSFYNVKEVTNPALQFFINETFNSTKASALILNTVDDLDEPFLSQIGVVGTESKFSGSDLSESQSEQSFRTQNQKRTSTARTSTAIVIAFHRENVHRRLAPSPLPRTKTATKPTKPGKPRFGLVAVLVVRGLVVVWKITKP